MKTLFAIALLALPAPAFAGAFTPPEGCETFLTVQSRQCRVSNHYRCAADTPGDQWRVDYDQQGPYFMSRINREAEWVESYDLGPPQMREDLVPNPEDPASFSELLANGVDSFSFSQVDETGVTTNVTGFDKLTGKTFTIDGVTLAQTQFEFTQTDENGTILRQSRGNEYISEEWRLFFSGPSEWNGGDGQFLPMDGSPVQFILPGEEGFESTEPLFDCDPLMTSLPQSGSNG